MQLLMVLIISIPAFKKYKLNISKWSIRPYQGKKKQPTKTVAALTLSTD